MFSNFLALLQTIGEIITITIVINNLSHDPVDAYVSYLSANQQQDSMNNTALASYTIFCTLVC